VQEPTFLGYVRPRTPSLPQTAVLTPDGKRVVLGTVAGTIIVIDAATRRQIGAPIRVFDQPIVKIRPSPDGSRATALREDGKRITVVDLGTGRKVFDITPGQTVAAFDISADGAQIAAGGYVDPPGQPKVFVWDAGSGAPIATLAGDPSPLTADNNDGPSRSAVAFSSTGLLAVGSDADTIALFDAKTLARVGSLGGVPDVVGLNLAFNTDGSRLVSGEPRSNGLMLWDVAARRSAWPERVDAQQFAVTIAPNGDVVYSNRTGEILRLAAANGQPVSQPVSLQAGSVCDLQLSNDGSTLIAASCNEPTAALFSLDGRATIGPMASPTQEPIGYSADGRHLLTASEDGWTIRDARSFAAKSRVPNFASVGFAVQPFQLIALQADGRGGRYDYRKQAFVYPPVPIPNPTQITMTGLDQHSGHVALGYDDGTVIVLGNRGQVVAPKGIRVGEPNTGRTVHGLSFSPDGTRLLVAAQNERAQLFDTRTGKPVGSSLPGAANAAISPDGKLIATAAFGGTVAVYDLKTLKPVGQPLTGSRAWSESLTWSRDARFLATVALDSSARVFDVAARQAIGAPLAVAPDAAAALRPDGRAIALTGTDPQAPHTQVWDFDPTHWRKAACLEAGRNLTRTEWAKYLGGSYRPTCAQWPSGA